MKLSVIIVNYNVKYFLEVCLDSVFRAARGINIEVIVIDNQSVDDSCAMVREKYPQVILIENKDNKGFSKANNQGFAIAKGEYILFLNPDTVLHTDYLKKTILYLDAHPNVGGIGPRIIDGKGQFALDSKKSFPSLSVALFKTTGINKIFSKSTFFNKYYAVHIKEYETAEVDVLSGCCMMVSHKVLQEIGGAFDEDYFMYCEDVDLSYRIQKAGYKNIYFPEATIIHYKGESTRKATLSYIRTFNEALSIFVKKHYSKQQASLFNVVINIGIAFRAFIGVAKRILKVFRMPILDAIALLFTLVLIQDFWIQQVKNMHTVPLKFMLVTFPIYILLWVLSMFMSGAYDQPYRGLRVMRGMAFGTITVLAFYGLLQPELRFSRAMIVFTGFTGTVVILGLHELMYRLGVFKFIRYDTLPRKAVIVAEEKAFEQTSVVLNRVHYGPNIEGRISPTENKGSALATTQEMKEVLYTAGINEVIFCVNGLDYGSILDKMQECGKAYDYKIHLPNSQSFVGSNSSHTSGDLYTIDRRFNLSEFAQLRNKRTIDVVTSFMFLCCFPILFFVVKKPTRFIVNCCKVLLGNRTWVGYANDADVKYLPMLRTGIIPPYYILNGYEPSNEVKIKLNAIYAEEYSPATDAILILRNFRYLGTH
jgi:GT2 family glycosyltransferase